MFTMESSLHPCYNTSMRTGEDIARALQTIRAPIFQNEYDLHAVILIALQSAGIEALHEVTLAPRRRIDFLCEGVGLEVKRGRPQRTALLKQLTGYAQNERVTSLVLIADHPPRLPDAICGKKLIAVSLHKLWGIAI